MTEAGVVVGAVVIVKVITIKSQQKFNSKSTGPSSTDKMSNV